MGRNASRGSPTRSHSHEYAPWLRIDPSGLFGRAPKGFAEHVGWKYEARGSEHWIRPDRPPGRPARHIRAHKLAWVANAHTPGAYSRAASLPKYGLGTSVPDRIVRKQMAAMRAAGTVTGAVAAFELAVAAAAEQDLPATVEREFQHLLKQAPNASLWLVTIDALVNRRLTAVKGLVAVERTPEMFTQQPGTVNAPVFQSATGQLNSLLVGAEYLIQPALTVAAPYVIGSGAPRAGGLLVVLFDQPVDGRDGLVPAGLLSTAGASGFASDGVTPWQPPQVAAQGIDAWFTWYINALNAFVAELLDPRPHADDSGAYRPAEHLALLITVERLFTSVVNVLAQTGREEYVAKTLAFTALDCLESLPGHPDRVQLLRPTTCQASLDAITATAPAAAHPLLERLAGVPAQIAALADGFFEPARRRPSEILLRAAKTGVPTWTPEDLAVASYLNLVRNGTHGYHKFVGSPREADLLLGHNGAIPRAVADIPVLHALRLLAEPVSALGRRS